MMHTLVNDFLGFCLVIFIPMGITVLFLTLKDMYDSKHFKKGYEAGFRDATIRALKTLRGEE